MSTDPSQSFLIERFDIVQSGALAGVLFAEDFELIDPSTPTFAKASPAPEPPPKLPTEADLREAHAQGVEQGRCAALDGLGAQQQAAEAAACDALTAALASARQAAGQAAAEAARTTGLTVLKALATVLPELCSRHGAGEVEALLKTLLTMLHQQPDLVVRANPHTLTVLRRVVSSHALQGSDHIQLIATDALAEGDVAIDWHDGAATRDDRALQDEVRRFLQPLERAAEREAAVQRPLHPHPPGSKLNLADTRDEMPQQLTELTDAG